MLFSALKRQVPMGDDNDEDDNQDHGYWWYSPAASAIKWAIIGAIFLIAILWLVGGYYHAQRRMRKGLRPLAYHRWLLPRSQRARFSPNQLSVYQQQGGYYDGYQMQTFPPPAYDPAHVPPPVYQPPESALKVNSSEVWDSSPPGPAPGESSSASETRRHSTMIESSNSVPQTGPAEPPPRPIRLSLVRQLNPFK